MNSPFFCGPVVNPQPPLALRPADATKALGISQSTLERLTRAGEIPCVKLDRAKIYPYHALQRWLTERAEGDKVMQPENRSP